MLVRKGIIACCLSFVDYPKEKWQVGSVERVGNTALSCRRRQRRTALFPRRPWFCCAAGHDYEEAFYPALGLTTHNHPFFFPFFVKKEESRSLAFTLGQLARRRAFAHPAHHARVEVRHARIEVWPRKQIWFFAYRRNSAASLDKKHL